MSRNPDLLGPHDRQYYTSLRKWERPKFPRSLEQLTKDAYEAHDRIKDLVRENDRLRKQLFELGNRQRWQLRIFIALMTVTWTVLGGALKFLLPYAIHGMVK